MAAPTTLKGFTDGSNERRSKRANVRRGHRSRQVVCHGDVHGCPDRRTGRNFASRCGRPHRSQHIVLTKEQPFGVFRSATDSGGSPATPGRRTYEGRIPGRPPSNLECDRLRLTPRQGGELKRESPSQTKSDSMIGSTSPYHAVECDRLRLTPRQGGELKRESPSQTKSDSMIGSTSPYHAVECDRLRLTPRQGGELKRESPSQTKSDSRFGPGTGPLQPRTR
jgi:hypothetical protein